MGAVAIVTSLWNDPLRWKIVKSTALFALGVYIARQMSAADEAAVAELAAGVASQ